VAATADVSWKCPDAAEGQEQQYVFNISWWRLCAFLDEKGGL